VQASTRRSIRSGRSAAIHIPTIAPSDGPQNDTRSIPTRPSASSSRSASSATDQHQRRRADGAADREVHPAWRLRPVSDLGGLSLVGRIPRKLDPTGDAHGDLLSHDRAWKR
jgi:hypothetical protein